MYDKKFLLREYEVKDSKELFEFFSKCLPQSGRVFDPNGIHSNLLHVEKSYDYFICLFEEGTKEIIGTSALKKIDKIKCELKCVYLDQEYYGKGLGTRMCKKVIDVAKEQGYKEIYLDTISKTSGRAIKMYKRLGFIRTEKYNESLRSDVFMKLIL